MTGFAWNPLGAIWLSDVDGTNILAVFLPWIGTYGLSGLTAFFAASFCIRRPETTKPAEISLREKRLHFAYDSAAFSVLAVLVISTFVNTQGETRFTDIPITIIQPNVSQADKWEGDAAAVNFTKLAQPTKAATREREVPMDSRAETDLENAPRLIFWPEAAIPDYLEDGYPLGYYRKGPVAARTDLAMLLGPDDLLLLGALKLEFNASGTEAVAARNSVMMVNALGQLSRQRYDKSHLVPGGEYLPLRSVLEPMGLDRLAPGDLEFRPGPGAGTLDTANFPNMLDLKIPKLKVGVQICYEIIFSGQVVDRKNRPDFIFNPSNDAWFGSWGPPQHLAQARMRAIEEGLPTIRATPTGISAVIDAQGRVFDSIAMGAAGRIDALLPAPAQPTLFSRFGNVLPVYFALILYVFAIALARRTR
jgi:apolipoprotein N-acyltransferase